MSKRDTFDYDDSYEIPELKIQYFIINKNKKYLRGYYTFVYNWQHATKFDHQSDAENYINENNIKGCYVTNLLVTVEDLNECDGITVTNYEILEQFINNHINELMFEPWSKLDEICTKHITNYISYDFNDNNSAVIRVDINNEIVEYSVDFTCTEV